MQYPTSRVFIMGSYHLVMTSEQKAMIAEYAVRECDLNLIRQIQDSV